MELWNVALKMANRPAVRTSVRFSFLPCLLFVLFLAAGPLPCAAESGKPVVAEPERDDDPYMIQLKGLSSFPVTVGALAVWDSRITYVGNRVTDVGSSNPNDPLVFPRGSEGGGNPGYFGANFIMLPSRPAP